MVVLGLILFYLFRTEKSPSAEFFNDILIGHRGCRHIKTQNIPENSLSAVRYSIEHGSEGVELDCQLTKDGHIVVFHDTLSMGRVAYGIGPKEGKTDVGIGNLTLEEIKNHYRYIDDDSGEETIPTLEEYIQFVFSLDPKQVIMIEVKQYSRLALMAEKLDELYHKYPQLYTQSTVASFNPALLYVVRKRNPKIVTNLLFKRGLFADWMKHSVPKVKKNGPGLQRVYSGDFPTILQEISEGSSRNLKDKITYNSLKLLTSMIDFLWYQANTTVVPAFIGAAVLGFDTSLAQVEYLQQLQKRGYVTNVWVVNDEKLKKTLLDNCRLALTTDFLFPKAD
ncbi:hypothetical protein C9374_013261 [Naegleria lovaniensis]|uniref:GP-PDE domain-containing protein n=1 Tax=Naegleria lovaniensis TaxID=51637 RepID=A0AA88KPR7_NAELO|nr:uncharacterized protein C9374_013261 [Naegleria lovaniensis]KAG2391776.1 hypothetical protein C9374_013261 [Naegleria lovaniensis]